MKKTIISSLFIITFSSSYAQPPRQRSTLGGLEQNYQNFSSRKETVIEKEIIKLGKFKDLNFQKIVLKDLSDNSTLNVFAIMALSETFDNISKKTITFEKEELTKLIDALQKIQQNSSKKPDNETKYKYLTKNNIEVGSNYNPVSKTWEHYLKFAPQFYSQDLIQFSSDELNELIKMLKTAEQKL